MKFYNRAFLFGSMVTVMMMLDNSHDSFSDYKKLNFLLH